MGIPHLVRLSSTYFVLLALTFSLLAVNHSNNNFRSSFVASNVPVQGYDDA